MAVHIRDYGAADHDAVVELSLRAWTPVFASMEAVLGAELATRLHGEDWRLHQARSVSETLADPANHGWVAQADEQITGFVVAATADPDRRVGEIAMLAVDPADQRQGLGRALTDHATAWRHACGSDRDRRRPRPRPGAAALRAGRVPPHAGAPAQCMECSSRVEDAGARASRRKGSPPAERIVQALLLAAAAVSIPPPAIHSGTPGKFGRWCVESLTATATGRDAAR